MEPPKRLSQLPEKSQEIISDILYNFAKREAEKLKQAKEAQHEKTTTTISTAHRRSH